MKERVKGERGAARTELVAVRFDAALKKRMEAAAERQLRSVANYVEWAVLRALEVDETSANRESVCTGSEQQHD